MFPLWHHQLDSAIRQTQSSVEEIITLTKMMRLCSVVFLVSACHCVCACDISMLRFANSCCQCWSPTAPMLANVSQNLGLGSYVVFCGWTCSWLLRLNSKHHDILTVQTSFQNMETVSEEKAETEWGRTRELMQQSWQVSLTLSPCSSFYFLPTALLLPPRSLNAIKCFTEK